LKKLIYLLCILSVIFASCHFDRGDKPLRVAIDRPMSTLNYQKTSAASDMEQIAQVMEGLLVFDAGGEVVPAGAKSWSVSDDGLVYEFVLREDALWQDGTSVLAQDYYFAWLQIVQHKTSPFAYTLFPIKGAEQIYDGKADIDTFGVEVQGDYGLKVTLHAPYLSFIYSLATPTMYPLKQSFYESVGADNFGTAKNNILTNGPYEVASYDAASKLFLHKSETYWDQAHVAIPEIEVLVVREEAARRALFDEGNLDLMAVGADSLQHYETKANKPQIVMNKTARVNYLYLSGNTAQQNALLANKNLRQAIAHAINRETLTNNILKDGSAPLTRLVPCEFAFVDGVDYCTLGAKEHSHVFDLARAQRFFAQAQAELGHDLTLELVYQETEHNVHVLEHIKFQLEQALVGLHINLKGVPVAGYSALLRKDGVASAVQTWSGSFANPEVYLQILEKDSTFNFGKYDDVAFQMKYNEGIRATDKGRQFQLYAEAEDIALASYMLVPLYQQGTVHVLSNRVRNVEYHMTMPNISYKNIQV